MSASPIPEGYHSLTPYLICKGATAAIEFYKKAFNAQEVMKLVPGDSGTGMCLYVENCDEVFAQAIAAGATEKRPMMDQFYGDRSGTLVDPFGHVWTVSTHIEDLSPEQIDERMAEWMQSQGGEQGE